MLSDYLSAVSTFCLFCFVNRQVVDHNCTRQNIVSYVPLLPNHVSPPACLIPCDSVDHWFPSLIVEWFGCCSSSALILAMDIVSISKGWPISLPIAYPWWTWSIKILRNTGPHKRFDTKCRVGWGTWNLDSTNCKNVVKDGPTFLQCKKC